MRYVALIAVAIAAAFGVASVAAAGGSPSGDTTLNLRELDNSSSQFAFVDLGTTGVSLGDELIVNANLARPNGHRVGEIEVSCTVTRVQSSGGYTAHAAGMKGTGTPPSGGLFDTNADLLCEADVHINGRGDIFLEALTNLRHLDHVVGAITGGDGDFARARGTFTSDDNGHGSSDVLTFRTS